MITDNSETELELGTSCCVEKVVWMSLGSTTTQTLTVDKKNGNISAGRKDIGAFDEDLDLPIMFPLDETSKFRFKIFGSIGYGIKDVTNNHRITTLLTEKAKKADGWLKLPLTSSISIEDFHELRAFAKSSKNIVMQNVVNISLACENYGLLRKQQVEYRIRGGSDMPYSSVSNNWTMCILNRLKKCDMCAVGIVDIGGRTATFLQPPNDRNIKAQIHSNILSEEDNIIEVAKWFQRLQSCGELKKCSHILVLQTGKKRNKHSENYVENMQRSLADSVAVPVTFELLPKEVEMEAEAESLSQSLKLSYIGEAVTEFIDNLRLNTP